MISSMMNFNDNLTAEINQKKIYNSIGSNKKDYNNPKAFFCEMNYGKCKDYDCG